MLEVVLSGAGFHGMLQEGISGVRHTAGKTAVHSSLEDRTGRVDHRGGSLTSLHACSLVSGVPDARARPDACDELIENGGLPMALAARSPPSSCVRYTGERDRGFTSPHYWGKP